MYKDKCSIRTSMEEEDKVVEGEAYLAKADTTKGNPISITSTTIKMPRTRGEEHLVEQEKSCQTKLTKKLHPMQILWQNSATTRQSVERRKVNQPSQADNSLTTPQNPTMTIMAECS